MYWIVVDQETEEQIDVLTIAPWNGDPINNSNPGGPLRMWPFGIAGILTYLILEDQRRVDLVRVVWVS